MKNTPQWLARALIVTALGASLTACGTAQNATTSSQEEVSSAASPATQSTSAAGTPKPSEGAVQATNVATFDGPKYITNAFASGQAPSEASVVPEACTINTSDTLAHAESIAWGPASITYNRVAKDWGNVTYRYEYLTKTGTEPAEAAPDRTTETGYFGQGRAVEHAQIGEHGVSFAMENSSDELVAIGIVDLEAKANNSNKAGSFIMLNAWEPRSEGCAFAVSISCEVNEGADANLTAEELLTDAYAPLTFEQTAAPSQPGVASSESDVTITSADDSRSVVVHRKGDTLVSYGRHKVILANPQASSANSTLTVDYAPEGGLDAMDSLSADTSMYNTELGFAEVGVSNKEDAQVEGRAWHARTVTTTIAVAEGDAKTEHELRAWTEVDGNALYVITGMDDGEDVATALLRTLTGRLDLR